MSDFIEELYKEIGSNDCNQSVTDYLDTGILPLNKIISGKYTGGIPVGRITEISGAASCGKTLVATMALIQTQIKKGMAVFLDYEHAFDVERGKTLGLVTSKNKWIYKQPTTAEDGFEIIEKIIGVIRKSDTKIPITIVIDSIASMITKAELDAKYDPNMKTRLSLASFLSSALKQIASKASKFNITLIFLNQIRENPSVMFGDKEYTAGGNAMKFYASVRIKLVKGKKIEDAEKNIIGETITAKIEKNKIAPPFQKTIYISDFSMGVDLETTHINVLEEMGLFGKIKGYVEFEGKKYRKKELVDLCRQDKKLYQKLLSLFKDNLK